MSLKAFEVFFIVAFIFVQHHEALARSQFISNASFNLGFGFSTYKSKLVASNDTSNSTGYDFGIWGGDYKQMNMTLRTEMNSTNFAYAKVTTTSSVKTTLQDFIIRYRWRAFYLGLVISQLQTEVLVPRIIVLRGQILVLKLEWISRPLMQTLQILQMVCLQGIR